MDLKELRVKNVSGVKEARLIFDQNGNVSIEPGNGNFPCDRSAREFALEALGWVLFGELKPDARIEEGCSAEFEFDNFAVYRKCIPDPPGISLRLFRYGTNRYCCATTVRDLTTKTVEETQREIVNTVGFSDVQALRDMLP